MDHARKKLDEIDAQIIALLAKRQSYIPAIGKYKQQKHIPILQPKREQSIITSKKRLAKKLGLAPVLVEKVFKSIFEHSRKIQRKAASK